MSEQKPNLVPAITAELLEENERQQAAWRDQFAVTPASAETHFAALINANREILESLCAVPQPSAAIVRQIERVRDETADALAATGDFARASRIAADTRKQRLYDEYETADQKENSDWCEHARWQRTGGKTEQVAYREFDYNSTSQGGQRSMIRCRRCGFRNGMPLADDLAKLSEHRARIVGATENGDHPDSKQIALGMVKDDLAAIIR